MLKKLFGIIGGATAAVASADEVLLRQIAPQRDSDPLIGAKIGGREITQQLFTKMNSERSVHIESMLCALGALAGHACQASIRARNVARGVPETTDLVAVDTQDGKRYFFGDAINHPLAEAQYSIWAPPFFLSRSKPWSLKRLWLLPPQRKANCLTSIRPVMKC